MVHLRIICLISYITLAVLSTEYVVGNKYLLPATTPTNRLANFEIYGVVDLENNNEPHTAGIYKDTVSIMITW